VTSAAIYRVTVRHTRLTPFRYRLTHRSYQWLVDLADLPRFRWPLNHLARFRTGDHLGDPQKSIRDNMIDYCATEGVDVGGGRIMMLTTARTLGHVFNPLTVFWCHDRDGELACVVAEVHNTYGERHRYLLATDTAGRSRTDKTFRVSPFFTVDGEYRLTLPQPDSRLHLAITLRVDDRPVLIATVSGQRRPAGAIQLLAAAVRHPFSTVAVSAAIRWHGIRLYLRGLPVVSHPADRGDRPPPSVPDRKV